MFWIGLGVGLILGDAIGTIAMAIFIVGRDCDNSGNN